MTPSRDLSQVKAAASLAAECASAVVMQLLLLPAYGLHPTLGQALQTSVRFAVLSLLHGAAVLRPLNGIGALR